MTHELGHRARTALAWTLVALGQVVFFVIHLAQYIGELAAEAGHGHGHSHVAELEALGEPAMLWLVTLWCVLVLVPAAVVVLSGARWAAWTALVVGGLTALAGVADGLNHAVADGAAHSLVAALLAVGLTGTLAALANVSWLRRAATPETAA